MPLLDQTTFDAVRHILQAHPAVADVAAAEAVQQMGFLTDLRGNRNAIPKQQALVPASIAEDLHLRRDFGIALNKPPHNGRQAGGQTSTGKHSDFFD